jgi:hypothetical protein
MWRIRRNRIGDHGPDQSARSASAAATGRDLEAERKLL